MNFADFCLNNIAVMQNNRTFKKYVWEKLIFWKFVLKIVNFSYFLDNVFTQIQNNHAVKNYFI